MPPCHPSVPTASPAPACELRLARFASSCLHTSRGGEVNIFPLPLRAGKARVAQAHLQGDSVNKAGGGRGRSICCASFWPQLAVGWLTLEQAINPRLPPPSLCSPPTLGVSSLAGRSLGLSWCSSPWRSVGGCACKMPGWFVGHLGCWLGATRDGHTGFWSTQAPLLFCRQTSCTWLICSPSCSSNLGRNERDDGWWIAKPPCSPHEAARPWPGLLLTPQRKTLKGGAPSGGDPPCSPPGYSELLEPFFQK